MIFIAFRKVNADRIDALRFLAHHQVIDFIYPPPDLEFPMQIIYNGHANIWNPGNKTPNDAGIAREIEQMPVEMATKLKTQYPKAPPFRFNDQAFEDWRKLHMKLKKGETYFGFTDRTKIRKAMKKIGLIVGGPGELIALAEEMKRRIRESEAGKAA